MSNKVIHAPFPHDKAVGGSGDDVLIGSDRDETFSGGGGLDHLLFGGGHDVAKGGAGSDFLVFNAFHNDAGVISYDGLVDLLDYQHSGTPHNAKTMDYLVLKGVDEASFLEQFTSQDQTDGTHLQLNGNDFAVLHGVHAFSSDWFSFH
jgi:Ca2+-binding RTX toxin-like protein